MSLTLYRASYSSSALSEQVLAALGIEYKPITLSIKEKETKKDSYLAINPNGLVPTLVLADGTVIWESCAITLYLGETYGVEKGLYPAPGSKRAEAMKWITWSSVTLVGAGDKFYRVVASGKKEGEEFDKVKDAVTGCVDILEKALEGKDYLLGDFSLVDVHSASITHWLTMFGYSLEGHKTVKAWVDRYNAKGIRPLD